MIRGRMSTADSNHATRKQIAGGQSRAWHLASRIVVSSNAISSSLSLEPPKLGRYDADSTNMPPVKPHFSTAFGSQSRGQHTFGSPRWIQGYFQPDSASVEALMKIIVKSWLCCVGVRGCGCCWITVSRPWTNSNWIHLEVSPKEIKNKKSGRRLPKGVFVFLTPRANDIGMIYPVILLPLPQC